MTSGATHDHDRRTFLKTTSLVGMAGYGSDLGRNAAAQTAENEGTTELAEGHDLCTLRAAGRCWRWFRSGLAHRPGYPRVIAAEQDFREGAPTSIDAVFKGQGDINGLKAPPRQGARERLPPALTSLHRPGRFGPCVNQPGNIVCIGLITASMRPKPAIRCPSSRSCSTKYNTALNPWRRHRGSEEDAQKFD